GLWLRQLNRDVEERVLALPIQAMPTAVWSPDVRRIAFSAPAPGSPVLDLYVKDVGGGAEKLLLQTGNAKFPSDWSPDGRFLLYTEIDPKTGADLWILPDPANPSADTKAVPFVRSQSSDAQGQFSPDGRWVAYTSVEGVGAQVYVRPFPNGD